MAKLKALWIEIDLAEIGGKKAIRIDWDNDRHQRIVIEGDDPESVSRSLKKAGSLIAAEIVYGKI
ncbi:MAG: hypothetical protein EOM23_08735 [Candidatus Moranbacteria bacterium]|nr:hypothetical protein [Candidatus Moranbacteria bacterium]